MAPFMGTHQSKLDSKGRVSIPAPFRTVLRDGATEGAVSFVLRPSHVLPCLEGWPVATFDSLADPLQRMALFSADHEDLSAALYADAYPVESDREGRIVLPDWLARHASLSDAVVFMGQGASFRIWEPRAAEQRRAEARARALAKGLTLPGTVAPPGAAA
jgi:MraZ protein